MKNRYDYPNDINNRRLDFLKRKCDNEFIDEHCMWGKLHIEDMTIQEYFIVVRDKIKKEFPDDDILNVDETNENAIRLWVKLNL